MINWQIIKILVSIGRITKYYYIKGESHIRTTPGIAEAGLEFEHLHEVVGLVTVEWGTRKSTAE